MLRIICTALLCLFWASIFSQDLKISNGKKEKIFSNSSLFHMVISFGENYEECCNLLDFRGNIKAIRGDTIEMNLLELSVQRTVQEISFDEYVESHSTNLYHKFHRDSIQHMSVYPNYSTYGRKRTLPVIGGALIFTGLLTAANVWLVPDGRSKDRLRLSGGIQVGVGALMALIWKDKSYYFAHPRRPWRVIN